MHLIMHVHPIKNLQITSSYKKMEKLPANSFCVLSCVLVLFLSSVSAVTDDPQDKQVWPHN